MNKIYPLIIFCLVLIFFAGDAFSQRVLVNAQQQKKLDDFSARLKTSYAAGKQQAMALARNNGWLIRRETRNGGLVALQGINKLGFPVYLRTANTEAAAATRTNTVQPGGELGLSLSGSSAVLNNKLAIWDGGSVYRQHQEFAGKTITIGAGQAAALPHSTHVAGTLIAKGVASLAKGMAFNMATLKSYDYDDDIAEMSANAKDLLLSNHSYGDIAGWDDSDGKWTWYGLPGDTEDYLFGFYDDRAQAWDKIAYEAPYYLIVTAASNSHFYTGPGVGETYYGYKSRTDRSIVDKGPRPANISSNDGYDVIPTSGNAKNVLTVGSVQQLPNGPITRQSVVVSGFSSWGPTDDGRVKPDIMGMGSNVYSTYTGGPASYGTLSGTSMATPNVTGSLLLLQEYYAKMHHDSVMHAATLKGLVCHTAFDAGTVGPDYKFGWGVLDMGKAAQAITNNGVKGAIKEFAIQQGQTQTYTVVTTGDEPLAATIAWTDPEGTPNAAGTLNSRTPKLVNDLDITMSDETGLFNPWILNPENPAAAATTGNNNRDNVEQVYVANSTGGKTYKITLTHKGLLTNSVQDYSLVISGATITGLTIVNVANNLSAFPVPASSQLNVLYNVKNAGTLKIFLSDMAGHTVYSASRDVPAGNFNTQIGVANLANGVYALKLISAGGEVHSSKVIIAR
jgi:hypothetical protein